MIELFILIAGIVLLWKFSSPLNSLSLGAEEKANEFSEEIIADVAVSRANRMEKFEADTEGKKVMSHDEALRKLRGQ